MDVNNSRDELLSESAHYIFRNDPLELKYYVDKRVELSVADGTQCHGYVHTVDPVTGSYVLYDTSGAADADGGLTVKIIPGHAILKTTALTEVATVSAATESEHFSRAATKMRRFLESRGSNDRVGKSKDHQVARKKTVTAWLRRHLIAVADSADDPSSLTIMNALTIRPPYAPNDCCSNNEIILGKIQGILKSMPKDWNENDC